MSEIENQINITVVFLDTLLPTPTNGGLKNQDGFRKFVMEHQIGKWETKFMARPTFDRVRDYNDDALRDAFPKYSHPGLRGDSAVSELKEKNIRLWHR